MKNTSKMQIDMRSKYGLSLYLSFPDLFFPYSFEQYLYNGSPKF